MMSWLHTLSLIIIFAGFIMIAFAWQPLYKAQKEHRVATEGLYRYVRHPQYDGFLLIMIGYLVMWPTILTLFIFPVLLFMYTQLAKKEEVTAQKEFGKAYQTYKEKVSGFIPRLHSMPKQAASSDKKATFKKLKFFIITAGIVVVTIVTLLFVNSFFGLFVAATVNSNPISRLSVIGELEKQSGK